MAATTTFIQNKKIIGEVDGADNAIHALSFTGDTLKATLHAGIASKLINTFPNQDWVGEELAETITKSNEPVRVLIDY